jgi:hypothetical protein
MPGGRGSAHKGMSDGMCRRCEGGSVGLPKNEGLTRNPFQLPL